MTPQAASRGRRFRDDRRGATAVEFAILALPFLLAMLAILEYGYAYLIETSLDNATAEAARQIRTGQLQTSTNTTLTKQQQFQQLVCGHMSWFSNCSANLSVSAEVESSWTGQTYTSPTQNGQVKSSLPFNIGADNCIVLVHAYYPTPIITSALWTANNAKLANNSILLGAAALVLNEPYSSGTSSPPPSNSC